MGGFAPRLQSLNLNNFPFPGLPNLLLSASHLVYLELWQIPDSGYFSPESLAAGLSMMTRLETLRVQFDFPPCRHDLSQCLPPQGRALLPVLSNFRFFGSDEYLDDLVARIDAPKLSKSVIHFPPQISSTPQLTQFLSRTPSFGAPNAAYMSLSCWAVTVTLEVPQTFAGNLQLGFVYRVFDRQLSSLSEVCNSFSFHRALLSTVERLDIQSRTVIWPDWERDMKSSYWLQLLRPFTAVKNLYISHELVPCIAPVLEEAEELVQERPERATEVVPALQNLYLESGTIALESVQETIGKFLASRQLSGNPIVVSRWERTPHD